MGKKEKRKHGKRLMKERTPTQVLDLHAKEIDFERLGKDEYAHQVIKRMRENLPNLPPPFTSDRLSGEDADRLLDAPLIACRLPADTRIHFGRVRSIETGRQGRATITVRRLPDGSVEEITPSRITHILAFDSVGDISVPVEVEMAEPGRSFIAQRGQQIAPGSVAGKSVADEMIDQGLLRKETCIYSAYLMMWVDQTGRVQRYGITSEDSLCISRVGDGTIPVTLMEVRGETYHAAQHALSHIWRSELQVFLDPERRHSL